MDSENGSDHTASVQDCHRMGGWIPSCSRRPRHAARPSRIHPDGPGREPLYFLQPDRFLDLPVGCAHGHSLGCRPCTSRRHWVEQFPLTPIEKPARTVKSISRYTALHVPGSGRTAKKAYGTVLRQE